MSGEIYAQDFSTCLKMHFGTSSAGEDFAGLEASLFVNKFSVLITVQLVTSMLKNIAGNTSCNFGKYLIEA